MSNSKRIHGEPGTLYARCGGIFGVSSFVDRCMDRWMADDTLNANALVARWHASAQRPGFKFLVVQIVCSLTGGPQGYTGRPMDEAHKHLNISEREWDVFMTVFNDVCAEFGLPSEDVDDLNALMISMMDEIVCFPGERPRPDPGPMRPGGNSLYARVGGVYPIALFVDRLVDALLADDRVQIPIDGTKRNEGSLKYLCTELLCKLAGGPEAVTAAAAQETWLLVPRAAWPIVQLTARLAVDHIEHQPTRDALLALLERHKNKLIDPSTKDGPLPGGAAARRAAAVKSKEQASWDGSDKLLSRAAINARHAGGGASVAARRRVHGDPRTLYGRGGGVFGLAKLSHHLMEAWMADPMLNDNAMVARWHTSQQKAGFIFLVTQIMGYMSGGPQRYTGRPMEEAHMHLGIRAAEWQQFMRVADDVFERTAVPIAARREMRDILMGFQQQCVLPPGVVAPPDPGAPRPHPSSVGTSFHRLGGVYPIAQFADRLVDALQQSDAGRAVGVAFDDIDDAAGRRHPPGIKYMLTELLCSAAGGQEVVTAKGFAEAKLGVPAGGWAAFCALAAEHAAAVFPTPHHRAMALALLADLRPELCADGADGADAELDAAARRMRRVEAAGFERFDAIAALHRTDGDEEEALELLVRGWRPEGAAAEAAAAAAAASAAPKCPFLAGRGAMAAGTPMPAGHPAVAKDDDDEWRVVNPEAMPAPAAAPAKPALPAALTETVRTMAERASLGAAEIAAMLKLDVAAVEATLKPPEPAVAGGVAPLPPGLAEAAKTMAERGVSTAQIAGMLKVEEAAVEATVAAPRGGGVYKSVGDPMQQRLDALLEEDEAVCCPVTLVLLVDPVTAWDGFVYERSAAEALCTGDGGRFVSPMTREALPAEFTPAVDVRDAALAFRRERAAEMLTFAEEAAAAQQEMAMSVVDRVSEYLAAMPPEAVAMLAARAVRACDALLRVAHTTDQPQGVWHAKPQQLRRVHALKLQVTAGGGGADLRQLTCLVCFDDFPALRGVECNGGEAAAGEAGGADGKTERHFVCEECFAGHVGAAIGADALGVFVRRGGVRCVDPGCGAPVFSDAALAKALPEAAFTQYTAAKERVAEQRINAQLEHDFEERLQVERARAAAAGGDAEREATRQHIVERILTLACPRCQQVFVDYDGCMALTCSRVGCGCGFCALCQADCGNDAHQHIGHGCPLAPSIGVKKGQFHLSRREYEKASARAREIKLREYLSTLTEARRQHALQDCQRELRDLGINPTKLGMVEPPQKVARAA